MIIACINFMNMSTARSAGRAKEVGLRQTLGSLRGQMIAQFLTESIIYSFLAVVLALTATYLLLPLFNELAGKELSQWKKFATGEPFQYKFLDENYDELFRAEQRLGRIFTAFAGLAIFIACLGLFALAAFTAEQRTKEIGIRKAMGATVGGLTLMISKEFTWLVLIAFGLVVVPTWFAVNWWLESFAYRTELNPIVFVLGGVVAIVVAWLTVSYQSLKAASTSPVTSLRYE